MDTGDYRFIHFYDICDNVLYFNDSDPEMCCDALDKSNSSSQHLIQSKDNKCLLLDSQEQLQARDIPESWEVDCKFCLQMYNDSLGERNGRAVILYTIKDNKKKVLCCSENNEIHPVTMDLPSTILESTHKAVFYLLGLPATNMYTFESSAYPGMFLGFEPDENNPSLKKLVLCPTPPDEVDDPTAIKLTSP